MTEASYVPSVPVVATLAKRELVRFFRQRNRVIGGFVQPLLFWLLFSEGLRENDLGYAHFFPGTIAMILLFTAIFATISVIEDRNEGFLQGVLVAPITRLAMVLGKVLGGASIAMLQAMIFLVLGWLTVESVAPDTHWCMHFNRCHAIASCRADGPWIYHRVADGFHSRFPRHHECLPVANVASFRSIFPTRR